MRATIENKPVIHCPACGGGKAYEVGHILDGSWGGTFGPWQCDDCMIEFFGRKDGDEIEITETRPQDKRPMLSLLRFRDLYVVVDFYGQYGDREDDDWGDYLFHSHQCPTNIMGHVIEVFCPSEGQDPHGVFRFIAAIDDTQENTDRIENHTGTLEELFRVFHTDGADAPTEWPEENHGVLSFIADARREYLRDKAGKA